ncbi:MAG: DUF4157 domain-containing protein [Ktedonobacteraceae bacterium]
MHTRQPKSHNQDTAPAKPAESVQKAAVSAAAVTHVPTWAGGMSEQIPTGLVLQDASTIPGIQAKLAISQPNDPYEQEADRAAEQVMRMPAGEKPRRHEDMSLMRKENGGAQAPQDSPSIVQQALSSRGQPLDSNVQESMGSRFGQDFSHVRVHADTKAAESAQSVSALAYTVGSDVVFGKGQYRPETSEGQRLLAHELTHVVQQQNTNTPLIQRFEARIHESGERYGLTTATTGGAAGHGISKEEASAAYFGNWMRDMNQVFVPMAHKLGLSDDILFSMESYLATKKFGRTMTPEQFGYYIPAEHIDNPAGLTKDYDLLPKQPTVTTAMQAAGPTRPSAFDTPQEDVNPRTGTVLGANIFNVDQAGVMAYMRRSNLHIERRFELAFQSGRNPEGLMHFGAGLHAVEDLFAHSNWVEIAVSKVLQDKPQLLPTLHGAARRVFTYSPSVPIGKQNRPVLTTGSFTGDDTMISLSNELYNILIRPLAAPKSDAEVAAEERFTLDLLRALTDKLHSDASFRAAVRTAIIESLPSIITKAPGFETIAEPALNTILLAPLDKIYFLTTLINIPRSWKDAIGITALQTKIRELISTRVMLPAAEQIQTSMVEAPTAPTNLVSFMKENKRRAAGQSTESELRKMQTMEKITGRSVQQQQSEAQTEASKRVPDLEATPEPVLAGPSHSQIAKDHPSSPFFGLAFLLKTIADRTLGEKMVVAWDEKQASPTTPYQFPVRPTEKDAADLYDKRAQEAEESLKRGEDIVTQGRGIPEASYDLSAARKRNADQISSIAIALRTIANSPGKVSDELDNLRKSLGQVDNKLIQALQIALQKASSASRVTGSTLNNTVALTTLATRLDTIAAEVLGSQSKAPTHDEREKANNELVQARSDAFSTLSQSPSIDSTFSALVLLALDRQINSTAVSYSGEQRKILQGQQHILTDKNLHTLHVQAITLPDLSSKSPALRALLQETRTIFTHPYESTWWVSTVEQFIKQHPKQIMSEIEARNEGYPLFREP